MSQNELFDAVAASSLVIGVGVAAAAIGHSPRGPAQRFLRIVRLLTELFAIARSGSRSPSKSFAASAKGPSPAPSGLVGGSVKLPEPPLARIVTLSPSWFAVARSWSESPSKSAATTANGLMPTGWGL